MVSKPQKNVISLLSDLFQDYAFQDSLTKSDAMPKYSVRGKKE